ncbi:Uncharacterised protein [Dorea longicatena]|nr:Uncharacterised protein [Dorea longicatena]
MNGKKAKVVDFDALKVDISDLLKAGENEIRVEVASSLNNRLIARGYYEQGKLSSMELADNANNANVSSENEQETGADMTPLFDIRAEVKDYGMVGEVKLETYTRVKIAMHHQGA